MQKVDLGFGHTPFQYKVKADEDEFEINPKVIQESIGTWLGYDSLVPASKERDEFISESV